MEHFGGVEGKKDREDLWSDKLHIYRWDTPEGEWLMLNFNVDENGNEFCYGGSRSTALKDEKETYGW